MTSNSSQYQCAMATDKDVWHAPFQIHTDLTKEAAMDDDKDLSLEELQRLATRDIEDACAGSGSAAPRAMKPPGAASSRRRRWESAAYGFRLLAWPLSWGRGLK